MSCVSAWRHLGPHGVAWNSPVSGVISERVGVVNIAIEGQLLAGACLGLAAVLKEQALLFVLAEPPLAAPERRRDPTPWRAWAR